MSSLALTGTGSRFDSAPFRPDFDYTIPEGAVAQLDGEYREDLRIRGRLVNQGASVDDLNRATAALIDSNVQFFEEADGSIGVVRNIPRERLDEMLRRGVIQLPAGRSIGTDFDTSGGDVPLLPVQALPILENPEDRQYREGEGVLFTLRLQNNPNETVAVDIIAPPGWPGTQRRIFDSTNWNVAQIIGVSVGRDEDLEGGIFNIVLRAQSHASTWTRRIAVDVLDDSDITAEPLLPPFVGPDFGGTITPPAPSTAAYNPQSGAITINEGSTRTISVRMTSNPNETVRWNITTDSPLIALSGSTNMVFTSSNWDSDQTFVIRALEDDDSIGGTAVVSMAARGTATNFTRRLSVTVIDTTSVPAPAPTERGLVLSTGNTLSVDEGASRIVGVRLDGDPGEPVTVAVRETSDAISLTGRTDMVFDSSSWDEERLFTVTAATDPDEDDETASITLAASSTATNKTETIAVTVNDRDAPTPGPFARNVVLSATAVTLDEGQSRAIGVTLDGDPGELVTVRFAAFSGPVTLGGTTTMTFDGTNWNVAQFVVLRTTIDADRQDDTARVNYSATSPSRVTNTNGSITLTVNDITQAAQNVALSITETGTLLLNEGATRSVGVSLDKNPGETVTVRVSKTGDTLTLGGATNMVFNASNWNVDQVLTVSAATDADFNDETGSITFNVSSVETNLVRTLLVLVADLTPRPMSRGLVLTPTGTLILNEGAERLVNVRMDGNPGETVTVRIGEVDADINLSGRTTMTFNQGNWNVDQAFRVHAVTDADRTDDSATINLVSSSDSGTTTGVDRLQVRIVDLTPAPELELNLSVPTSFSVPEGSARQVGVRLSADPLGTARVAITENSPDLVLSGSTNMIFTSQDWNSEQSFTITALTDPDRIDDVGTVMLALTPEGSATDTTTLAITIPDTSPNRANLVVAGGNTLTAQEGSVRRVNVRLDADPNETVTVQATESDPDITLSGSTTMVFNSDNWSTDQSFDINVLQDADRADDSAQVNIAASSPSGTTSDTETLSITITDITPVPEFGLVVSPTSVQITEGQARNANVRLNSNPQGTVRVNAVSADAGAVTVTGGPLVFTADTWEADQTLTLTAVADIDADQEDVTVTLTATHDDSTDTETSTIAVRVVDTTPQSRRLRLTPASATIQEGGQRSIAVRLDGNPNETVTVVVSASSAKVSLSGTTTMTFNAASWQSDQIVQVVAVGDPDRSDESVEVQFTVTSVSGVSNRVERLPVTITDTTPFPADLGVVATVASPLVLNEGAAVTVPYRLSADPGEDISVAVTTSDSTVLTLTGDAAHTFDGTDWNSDRTLNVAVVADADSTDEAVTLTFTATRDSTSTVIDTEVINVQVNDLTPARREIVVSNDTVRLMERQGSGVNQTAVRVRLDGDPNETVTVNITEGSTAVGLTGTTSMVFNSDNWNTDQTFTVNAITDPDTVDATALVNLQAVSASGVNNATRTVTVTVVDTTPIPRRMVLSTGTLSMREGETRTFTVRLDGNPKTTATVALGAIVPGVFPLRASTDITLSHNMLTFTPSNWQTPQTVTVTAVADTDFVGSSAAIALQLTYTGTSDSQFITVGVSDERPEPGVATNMVVTPSSTLFVFE